MIIFLFFQVQSYIEAVNDPTSIQTSTTTVLNTDLSCTDDNDCQNGTCGDYCPILQKYGIECNFDKICFCYNGWYGPSCDLLNSTCDSSKCENNSKCNPYDNIYGSCDCTGAGHHGIYCTESDCNDSTCYNGNCQSNPNLPNDHFCDCGIGYEGQRCEISKCDSQPCNDGDCSNKPDYPFQIGTQPYKMSFVSCKLRMLMSRWKNWRFL